MAVDSDLFTKFDKALGATAELAASEAQAAFEAAKAVVEAGTASEHAAAVALDKALVRIKNKYGDAAMQAAREFYASQRELAGVAEAFGEYEPEFAQQVPDAFVAHDLAESVATQRRAAPETPLDFDALCESMRGKVMGYPVKASDWTMTMNARRDPAHPKWAFVAHAGACPWCVMISSNGFRFASEATAAAERHKHCTCPVVVDFDVDNPSLVGYDPDGMYERLYRCGEQIGSNDWADILKEAGNRDREWLRTGKPTATDYSETPRLYYGRLKDPAAGYRRDNIVDRGNEWRDIVAHDTLAANGIKAVARHRSKGIPDGYCDMDLSIDGELWEVKSPYVSADTPADPLAFVHRDLKKADHQFRHQWDEENGMALVYHGEKKVVLNVYYKDVVVDDRFMGKVAHEMHHYGISELLLIQKPAAGDGVGVLTRLRG